MGSKLHQYQTELNWTGNTGSGTDHYTHYERSYTIQTVGKPILLGSSDPAFRGDSTKYNPEELFLASLSSCHMLWYLHLCATHGIVVLSYADHPQGTMEEMPTGSGRFTHVTLFPSIVVAEDHMIEKAYALHHEANLNCFIANSVNFPVNHEPRIDSKT